MYLRNGQKTEGHAEPVVMITNNEPEFQTLMIYSTIMTKLWA
jgi:hypothetical protein